MDLVLSRDIPKLMEQFPHEGHFKTGVTERMRDALPPPPSVLALQGPTSTGDLYEHAPPPTQPQSAPALAPPRARTPPPVEAVTAALPALTMRADVAAAVADPWAVAPPPVAAPIDPWAEPPAASGWAIGADERAKYDEIFATLSPSGGKVGGAAVRPVLERSKLPVDTLRSVWQLSDVDKDGQLDRDEFALAMHLVRQCVAGKALPATLGPELIPPSKRAGSKALGAPPPGVAELE
jgi:hypothetical protein